MPGHNGLFARQLPIAFSYFEYTDIAEFGRPGVGTVECRDYYGWTGGVGVVEYVCLTAESRRYASIAMKSR